MSLRVLTCRWLREEAENAPGWPLLLFPPITHWAPGLVKVLGKRRAKCKTGRGFSWLEFGSLLSFPVSRPLPCFPSYPTSGPTLQIFLPPHNFPRAAFPPTGGFPRRGGPRGTVPGVLPAGSLGALT